MSLKGKVAIVTGGNSGIGKAIALELARQGANIVIDYVVHPEATEEEEKQIIAMGDQAIGVKADVSKVADLQMLIDEAVKAFGRVDIMVNNAGVETRTSVLDTTEAQYDKVIDINLTGTMRVCAAARPLLAKSRGAIVNTASMLSFFGGGLVPGYSASKGGVAQLTKSLSNQWAASGVNVNAIAPGYVDTDMVRAVPADVLQKIIARIPMGRLGRAEDIARGVAFLCADDADFITGSTLSINGGQHMY